MFRNIAALAGGVVLAAGLATTAAATTASAGVTPSPEPTLQTASPSPGYHLKHARVTPWEFDAQQSLIGGLAVNDAEGAGAIPMHLWSDTQREASPLMTFQLGGNSVTLLRDRLTLPAVNLSTCTATFDQAGGFRILRGTGTGAGLRTNNGQFDLLGMVSYPFVTKYHRGGVRVCPLAFLSPGLILRAIEFGVPVRGLPAPVFTDFSVQGHADVFRVRPFPVPAVTPTYTPAA